MEENFKVYCHENKINGKKYFGITKKVPEKRWRNGKSYMENKYFSNAIFKNGWDGFDHIILFENLSKKMACEIEIYLISKYNTTNQEYGYNLASGGEHPSPTKEIIKRMSIPIVRLSIDGKFIKEYDGAINAKRLDNFDSSAIANCCKGKQLTHKGYLFIYKEDYIEILRFENFNYDKKNINNFIKERECQRREIKQSKKEESSIYRGENKISRLSKRVLKFSLDGKLLGDWSGARIAGRELNINNSLISSCCTGRTDKANNFIFMYYEDYIKMNKEEFKEYINIKGKISGNKIVQLDINGEFIREWDNQREASRFYNITEHPISMCCQGKYKTACGYIWIRYEDYIKISKDEFKNKIDKMKESKKIVQLTKDFNFIKLWDRQVDASKSLKIAQTPISWCCKNKLNSAYGFKWMYYKDYIEKYGNIV